MKEIYFPNRSIKTVFKDRYEINKANPINTASPKALMFVNGSKIFDIQ